MKPAEPVGPWSETAKCIGKTDLFFSDFDSDIAHAKRICATCDHVEPCLEYALRNNQKDAVWGGMTREERRAVKTLRRMKQQRQ